MYTLIERDRPRGSGSPARAVVSPPSMGSVERSPQAIAVAGDITRPRARTQRSPTRLARRARRSRHLCAASPLSAFHARARRVAGDQRRRDPPSAQAWPDPARAPRRIVPSSTSPPRTSPALTQAPSARTTSMWVRASAIRTSGASSRASWSYAAARVSFRFRSSDRHRRRRLPLGMDATFTSLLARCAPSARRLPLIPARSSAPVDVVPSTTSPTRSWAWRDAGLTHHLVAGRRARPSARSSSWRAPTPAGGPPLVRPARLPNLIHPILVRTGSEGRRRTLRRSEIFSPTRDGGALRRRASALGARARRPRAAAASLISTA